ncbi:MAG: nucleotidyl transferase AbiEii/AbiGii toxin family protein [Candidatus Aminicenantes bacterium]|nr:nucleotidyl transferase AbiEii/AbiGii toxin family protein [Candidatus Aminicenantes bacterium]
MNWEKNIKALEQILIKVLKNNILPKKSYIAGGTALYYYLNHRISIDIDCFTPEPFHADTITHKSREIFDHVDVEIFEKDSLILFLSREKIKFSLFHFPYPLLSKLFSFEIGAQTLCPMASLEDIEAMKAIALVQRGSVKDFVDLYYLLRKTHHTFEDIFTKIQRKYQVDEKYDYHLKTAMVYFFDAEPEIDDIVMIGEDKKARKMNKKDWEKIKAFFVRFCL